MPGGATRAIAPIPQTPVQSAIAQAAAATGVDFTYLLAQARLESGLDPQARAQTSSARGLYQFTGATWLNALGRHGADIGFDAASAPQTHAARAQMLAWRGDPQVSALMAGELANDNRGYLNSVLGRDPDNTELYLAHFLGPDAAGRFLSALSTDPAQSAAALLPKAAAANRAIFFAGSAPRSVGQVMDLLRTRFEAAVQAGAGGSDYGAAAGGWAGGNAAGGGFLPIPAMAGANPPSIATGGPIAREFAAAAAPVTGSASMADTLQSAFGLLAGNETGATDTIPAHVRAAYGQIRALGL